MQFPEGLENTPLTKSWKLGQTMFWIFDYFAHPTQKSKPQAAKPVKEERRLQ